MLSKSTGLNEYKAVLLSTRPAQCGGITFWNNWIRPWIFSILLSPVHDALWSSHPASCIGRKCCHMSKYINCASLVDPTTHLHHVWNHSSERIPALRYICSSCGRCNSRAAYNKLSFYQTYWRMSQFPTSAVAYPCLQWRTARCVSYSVRKWWNVHSVFYILYFATPEEIWCRLC